MKVLILLCSTLSVNSGKRQLFKSLSRLSNSNLTTLHIEKTSIPQMNKQQVFQNCDVIIYDYEISARAENQFPNEYRPRKKDPSFYSAVLREIQKSSSTKVFLAPFIDIHYPEIADLLSRQIDISDAIAWIYEHPLPSVANVKLEYQDSFIQKEHCPNSYREKILELPFARIDLPFPIGKKEFFRSRKFFLML